MEIKGNEDFLVCDITGHPIVKANGWYGNNRIHISEKGVEQLIDEYITRNLKPPQVPFFVHTLTLRFLEKIKKNRYISRKLRKDILSKYKNTCAHCGSTSNLEIDHIQPISKGGTSDYKNLQVLCKTCNLKKSNKL